MKILHVSRYNNYGGAAIAGTRVYNSTIACNINSERIIGEDLIKTSKIKSSVIQLILNIFIKNKDGLISLNIFSSNIVKIINNSDADIIHLHWINDEMLSIRDIALINKPIIWSIMDMWPFTGSEHYSSGSDYIDGYKKIPIKNKIRFYINRWSWRRKKKYWHKPIEIITPSNWLKVQAKKSNLMKNCLNLSYFE